MTSKKATDSEVVGSLTRPNKLTPEIVVQRYEPMIRNQIRKFRLTSRSEDDLFHSCLDQMITPSKRYGTTPLDRYDPTIAYASTYIMTIVSNFLKGEYRREKREEKIFQEYAINPLSGQKEPIKVDRVIDADEVFGEVDQAVARNALLRALRTRKNKEFCSRNEKGKPRTTFRVAALLLLKGYNIAKIAEEFGTSQVEIRRRLGLLGNDATLRRIAEDYGWIFPVEEAG